MVLVRYVLSALALIVAAPRRWRRTRRRFPRRSVRLVVPAVAGGPVDAVARILAEALRTSWRETIVVESKPGAGNSTGAIYVAQSPPDGHTLLVISDSITINP